MKRILCVLLSFFILFGMGLEVFAEDVPHVHTPGEWTTIQEPTHTTPGVRQTTCTVCQEPYTESIPVLLLAVPGITAQPDGYDRILVSWDCVEGATGYQLYRKNDVGRWITLQKLEGNTSCSYADTNVICGKTYTYTVRALCETVRSGYDAAGASAKITIGVPSVTTAVIACNKVQITWDAIDGADGYYVYRKKPDEKWGSWRKTVSGGSTTAYTDSTVQPGITYLYTVKAYRNYPNGTIGYSAYNSTGVSAKPSLSAPSFKVSSSYNKITVSWGKINGASGYRIYRRTGNGGWARIATVGASTLSYADTKMTYGTTYYYTVRAIYRSADGKEILSPYNTAGIKGRAYLKTPSLKSVSAAAYNKIKVTWGTVAGANGYLVYRKTDGGNWKKIKTVTGQSSYTYTDATALTGVSYTYTVKAYRKVEREYVYSAYNTAGITGKAYLSKPKLTGAKFTGTAYAKPSIQITWSEVPGAHGYYVYSRSKDTGGEWERLATISGGTRCSYGDAAIKENVLYEYTVRAYRKVNDMVVRSGYDSAGIACRCPYAPQYTTALPEETKSHTTSIPMAIENTGTKTIRIYANGAVLNDSASEEFDRMLAFASGVSSIDIKPGQATVLTFQVQGASTWYDKNTKLYFYFLYDGVKYIAEASALTSAYMYY